MAPPDRHTLEWRLFDAYLAGLQRELEAKLQDLGRIRAAITWLAADGDAAMRVESVRAALGHINRMLDTNRVVRDVLLDLHRVAADLTTGGVSPDA